MTDQNLTEIICILDESGSMNSLVEDTIGGFNSFVEDQQELDGEVKLTLTTFDTESEVIHDGVDLDDVPELDDSTYSPSGSTALLDAVGETIDTVGERLANTSEDDRPGNVLVMIMTDGKENASQEYTKEGVKNRVQEQRDVYDWEFVFLGANIDAFAESASIGVSTAKTAQYSADSDGTQAAWETVSRTSRRYRKTGQVGDLEDEIESDTSN